METPSRGAKAAQGRRVLAFALAGILGLALYSALAGFFDALAFVTEGEPPLAPLEGTPAAVAQFFPAGASYGFFAPQVCSEFRLEMRLGNTRTKRVKRIGLNLGPEAALLVSSFSSSTQEKSMARVVAESYASYGFTRNPWADSAQVRLEAEVMPPLSRATVERAEWRALSTFYFKR